MADHSLPLRCHVTEGAIAISVTILVNLSLTPALLLQFSLFFGASVKPDYSCCGLTLFGKSAGTLTEGSDDDDDELLDMGLSPSAITTTSSSSPSGATSGSITGEGVALTPRTNDSTTEYEGDANDDDVALIGADGSGRAARTASDGDAAFDERLRRIASHTHTHTPSTPPSLSLSFPPPASADCKSSRSGVLSILSRAGFRSKVWI
jgi:hypothetical protein